ncbi:MAG: prephenate dehydrogenase [Clostridiaceae bacterium]|nr:prephenate dehydrogenase [Clostridiaceae bacterium]
MELTVKKIGIIGLGLIGGSIAKALKRNGKGYIIKAWNRDKRVLETGLSEKAIDEYSLSLKDGFSDCDVIFLCVPVFAMKDVINELSGSIQPHCILTDAGSTKMDVISIVNEMGIANPFIGGHPLAGSEKSGFAASRANLFENAYYCLTPNEKTDEKALNILKELVKNMGAIPIEITPFEHDRATAVISHVPHVIASLLVNLVGQLDGPDNIMKTIAAGGFRDITRIASSSPELWSGICLSNKDIILDTLKALLNGLKDFEENLRTENKETIERFFASARDLRNSFAEGKNLYHKTFDIVVDVDDKPGIIAVIATALAEKNINIKNIGILHNRESDEGALEIQFEDEKSRSLGLEILNNLGYRAKSK